MAWLLVQLKLRLLTNALRASTGAKVAFVLSTLCAALVAGGVFYLLSSLGGGIAAAEAIDTALLEPVQRRRAFRRFERLTRRGPKVFSWFIYRMTRPAMQDLFMNPRNVLRMREALLSLLAGDIFGRTPIWPSLRAFKLIYYLTSMAHPARSLAALWARVRNILAVEPERAGAG